MDFKTRLKLLREERQLTQKDLAKAVKVNYTTISDYERGDKTDPYMSTLKRIANYFDVSIDYLVGESDERELNTTQRLRAEIDSMAESERKVVLQYVAFLREKGDDK